MSLLLLSDPSATYPSVKVEWSPTTDPSSAAPVWVDITDKVYVGAETTRARQNELEQMQAGVAKLLLDNSDRAFDPSNTSSAYSPNVVPLRRFRITATLETNPGVTYYLFDGYVKGWPPKRQGPEDSIVPIDLVDAFEILGALDIDTTRATLTTALAGANNDVKFTAKGGVDGNNVSVTFIAPAPNPGTIRRESDDIIVEIPAGGGGEIYGICTASRLVQEFRSYNGVDLVDVELAAGNSGAGVLTTMAKTYLTGGTFVAELGGARITRLLDDLGWPAGLRSIDAGTVLISGAAFSADQEQKALTHAQDVADAEGGLFLADGQGRAVFQDRNYRTTGARLTSQATFGDDSAATELTYIDFEPVYDRDKVFNVVRIMPKSGVKQEASDATSISKFYKRVLSKNLPLIVTDAAAATLASFYLAKYKNPQLRIERLVIKPVADDLLWKQVLGREISDRITVKSRPPGGGPVFSQECFIEGIKHQIAGGFDWTTEFQLSPAA